MIGRLRQRGFSGTEIALTGFIVAAALVALAYLAVVGLPTQRTERTERVEEHVTTTQRVPSPGGSVQRVESRSERERRLREEVVSRLDQAQLRAAARAAVRAECARVRCGRAGPAGPKGDTGEKGADGQNGAPGRNAPGAQDKRLDSGLIDALDNRVADLERLTVTLLDRLGVLEGVVRLLCPLLTPGRCAAR